MKVLIPYDQIIEYESGDRFNWCNKGCIHFVVKEMNIDKDFFTELIIGRIENSFNAKGISG